jgi:hypothetical protein
MGIQKVGVSAAWLNHIHRERLLRPARREQNMLQQRGRSYVYEAYTNHGK